MNDVAACIIRHLQSARDTEWIDRICSDSNSITQCQEIIEDESCGVEIKLPAMTFLVRIIETFGDRWDSDFAMSIDQWCLGLIHAKPSYLTRDSALLKGLGEVYGCLIVCRYQIDELFGKFDERVSALLFTDDVLLHRMGLQLFASVTDRFCKCTGGKVQKGTYFAKTLPNCVKASMQTIGRIQQNKFGEISFQDEELLVFGALTLLIQTMSLETTESIENTTEDEIFVFTVHIPPVCTPMFSDPQVGGLLVALFSKFAVDVRHQCIEVLFRLVSIQKSSLLADSVNRLYNVYVDFMIVILSSDLPQEFRHHVCVTAYKLNLCLTDNNAHLMDSARALVFYQKMAELTTTVVNCQMLIESPETVSYIVKFWACLVRVLSHIRDSPTREFVSSFIMSLITAWHDAIEQAFVSNFDEMSAFFTQDADSMFHEFKLFAVMMEVDLEKYVSLLESESEKLLAQYRSCYSFEGEIRLVVTIDILTQILCIEQRERNEEKRKQRVETKARVFCAILNIVSTTDALLSRGHRESLLLEKKIFGFVGCLRFLESWNAFRSEEAKRLQTLTQKPYSDILAWLVGRVIRGTVQFCDNPDVLFAGLSLIRTIIDRKSVYGPQSDQILVDFALSQELLSTGTDRECRKLFFEIAVKFLVQGSHMEELQKLLERLGSQFAGQMQRYNELEFISLMNDLSIVFVVPTSYREYLPIFSWFYPHRMKELNSRLLEIVKHPLSFEAFLNTWKNFVNGKSERIRFGPFSADGIVLFKETAAIVGYFFDILNAHRDLSFENFAGMLETVVVMLQGVLSAGYVSFGVFKVYNDPVCDNTISTFFRFFQDFDYTIIAAFPSLAKNVCLLLRVIVERFFQTLVQLNVVEFVLSFNFFLMFVPTCDLEPWPREILGIILKSICANQLTVATDSIDKFLLKLFEVVLNGRETDIQLISTHLRGLLKLDFEFLNVVQSKATSQLGHDLAEKLSAQFDRITFETVESFGETDNEDDHTKGFFSTSMDDMSRTFYGILIGINEVSSKLPSFIKLSD